MGDATMKSAVQLSRHISRTLFNLPSRCMSHHFPIALWRLQKFSQLISTFAPVSNGSPMFFPDGSVHLENTAGCALARVALLSGGAPSACRARIHDGLHWLPSKHRISRCHHQNCAKSSSCALAQPWTNAVHPSPISLVAKGFFMHLPLGKQDHARVSSSHFARLDLPQNIPALFYHTRCSCGVSLCLNNSGKLLRLHLQQQCCKNSSCSNRASPCRSASRSTCTVFISRTQQN